MTALDALSSALRPSQAAEDVLSRLLAIGWQIVPARQAQAGGAFVEALRAAMDGEAGDGR